MIEYVEIRGSDTEIIGIIDIARSIIWRAVYFGVGDFEIYAQATPEITSLLRVGRYVTRPDNEEVGIIESINVATNDNDGTMITASGRFAKSMLDRRIIYNLSGSSNSATTMRGNVETAVREVVKDNAISCAFDSKRDMPLLALGDAANIPLTIVDADGNAAAKQVTNENLLTYTDGVLEEYGLAATCKLRGGKFRYVIYRGIDRSTDNKSGNIPIVFSKEYDNLTASEYLYNAATERNVALIGGEGEGIERFYTLIAGSEAGLQRREMFIDASGLTKKYKDASGVEQTYTNAEYKAMLNTKGKQDIEPLTPTESLNGTLDATNGNYVYGRDFALGDIVTVQDNELGVYMNVRIREAIEVQDENGYTVEINYQ